MEFNDVNARHYGVVVDGDGAVIEGGIREAVGRGLVTEKHCCGWWGLAKMANGDIFDRDGRHGEKYIVYRRMVNGVVALV